MYPKKNEKKNKKRHTWRYQSQFPLIGSLGWVSINLDSSHLNQRFFWVKTYKFNSLDQTRQFS